MKFFSKKADIEQKQQSYAYLFRKFTFLTVVCSVAPLLLVGWGLNAHYTYYSKNRIVGNFKNQVKNHRRFVEEFLKEQSSKLRLLTYTHSKAFLLAPGNLQVVLKI